MRAKFMNLQVVFQFALIIQYLTLSHIKSSVFFRLHR